MFPYIISIGPVQLPTYGVLVATAFLVALWITGKLAAKAGANKDRIVDLGVACAVAGIIGAKLNMILVDLPEYMADPGRIFSLSFLQAAGIFYGGFILALIAAWWFMRRYKLPVLATADLFAPGVAIGHAIGRLGCFAAGCCWGNACDRSWAVTFHDARAHELTGVPLGVPLHPTQIYESAAEVAIFFWLYSRIGKPHRAGAIIAQYLILYGLTRFVVDFFRNQEQGNFLGGPFTNAQSISLALMLFTAAMYFRLRNRPPRETP